MTGPAWLAALSAALMLLIAASCAVRLAIWRLRGRDTEPGADGLHVLMGVAMAGMFEPRLSPAPTSAWQAVFTAGAVWFAWQAVSTRTQRRRSRSWCAHPTPHAVECATMTYMLLPARPVGHALPMAMAGMNGSGGIAARNPALALILALFMLGYILWTTDQLATRRAHAATTALAPRFAACYKLVMSIAMAYMLITML